MTSISVTQARSELYQLVDDVAASHVPVQITGKRDSAVLVSEDDWRSIQETLYLLSIPDLPGKTGGEDHPDVDTLRIKGRPNPEGRVPRSSGLI